MLPPPRSRRLRFARLRGSPRPRARFLVCSLLERHRPDPLERLPAQGRWDLGCRFEQRQQTSAAVGEQAMRVPVRRESHRQPKPVLSPALRREPVKRRDVARGLARDLRHHLGHDRQPRVRREPLDSREPLVCVDDGAHSLTLGATRGIDNVGHCGGGCFIRFACPPTSRTGRRRRRVRRPGSRLRARGTPPRRPCPGGHPEVANSLGEIPAGGDSTAWAGGRGERERRQAYCREDLGCHRELPFVRGAPASLSLARPASLAQLRPVAHGRAAGARRHPVVKA
jgi:hypothetical protein